MVQFRHLILSLKHAPMFVIQGEHGYQNPDLNFINVILDFQLCSQDAHMSLGLTQLILNVFSLENVTQFK